MNIPKTFVVNHRNLCLPIMLAFLLLASAPAWGTPPDQQELKQSVAIVEFDVMGELGIADGGSIVAEWLVNALDKTGTFALKERVLLKKVLDEQQLSLTGLVDQEKSAARIGALYGVSGIISGAISKWDDTISVTARLINSATGSIERTAEIRAANLQAIPTLIDDLAQVLSGKQTQEEVESRRKYRLGASNQTEAGALVNLAGKSWTEPKTGMEFVYLKNGCFQMGQGDQEKQMLMMEYSPEDYEKLYADELPRHEVCVSGGWLASHEVNNQQFRLFKPKHFALDFRGKSLNGDEYPAVYVSWEDARDFAEWLSSKYDDRTFRLPTEAEWEYGCRAGTETPRFWGWDSDEACRFANVHDRGAEKENHLGWPPHDCDDGFSTTAPVGSLAPNPSGLYDMLGNVWEWTADIYDPNAYQNHPKKNPLVKEGSPSRVRRGGSWRNETGSIRCANRGKRSPNRRNNRVGFRLLMETR